jgi:uncharacterized protein (TIGR01244 family)
MRIHIVLVAAGCLTAALATAQQPTKEAVPGVTNFARVETTVACGGATKPEAVPELKKMGFASIINLRLPDEKDANIPAEQAAAQAAGMNFVHIPFSGSSPDPAAVDRFIDAVTTPANQPAYIHCAGGNRAAAMWMAKRLVVDKWDTSKATAEAEGLGMTSSTLRDFMITYAETHRR